LTASGYFGETVARQVNKSLTIAEGEKVDELRPPWGARRSARAFCFPVKALIALDFPELDLPAKATSQP
jgi:hypothetical protein